MIRAKKKEINSYWNKESIAVSSGTLIAEPGNAHLNQLFRKQTSNFFYFYFYLFGNKQTTTAILRQCFVDICLHINSPFYFDCIASYF